MRRYLAILALVAATCVLAGCERMRLHEARVGLEATVAGLPSLDGFSQVTLISDRAWDEVFGGECYYTQAIVVFGTSLSAQDALTAYVDALLLEGWIVEQDHNVREKVLHRGKHERAVVYIGPPGPMVELDAYYQAVKSHFPSFLVVIVDFILPTTEDC